MRETPSSTLTLPFRASDDSLVSPDLFDKLRDLFITLLNSADVSQRNCVRYNCVTLDLHVLAKLDDQVCHFTLHLYLTQGLSFQH